MYIDLDPMKFTLDYSTYKANSRITFLELTKQWKIPMELVVRFITKQITGGLAGVDIDIHRVFPYIGQGITHFQIGSDETNYNTMAVNFKDAVILTDRLNKLSLANKNHIVEYMDYISSGRKPKFIYSRFMLKLYKDCILENVEGTIRCFKVETKSIFNKYTQKQVPVTFYNILVNRLHWGNPKVFVADHTWLSVNKILYNRYKDQIFIGTEVRFTGMVREYTDKRGDTKYGFYKLENFEVLSIPEQAQEYLAQREYHQNEKYRATGLWTNSRLQ